MKKEQVLLLIKNALGLKARKESEGFEKEVAAMIEALENGLEVGDKAKIGGLVFEKKHVPARSGKAMGVEWTVEEHDELRVKLAKRK